MKSRGNNLLVGAFCLGALVLILGFSVFTGGFSSFRGENERFVLVFHENVYGLHEGGKVTLNGVRIGRVERFFLGDVTDDGPVPVLIEINRKLVKRHMIDEKNELFDNNAFLKKEVVSRLQAKLIQESFVTGILYINLTTGHDESELKELYGYREIPTQASMFAELSENINLEKLSKQVSELLVAATTKLNDLDPKKLSKAFSDTNLDLQTFLKNSNELVTTIGPKFGIAAEDSSIALKKLDLLVKKLNQMFDPSSEFRFAFATTLREISAMSKSLKSLADLLETNPQAFIRGKGDFSE